MGHSLPTPDSECRILYLGKLSTRDEGNIRTFSGEQKLRKFHNQAPYMKKNTREVLFEQNKKRLSEGEMR